MKSSHLFWMIGIVFAFGFLVERNMDEFTPVERTPVVVADVGDADQTYSWYGGEAVLDRQSDGHFYAEAYVDGSPVNFLVDTGATVVALTGDDAYNLGIVWSDNEIRQIGHGANGAVYGVHTSIREMELGGFSANNVSAVIIPSGLAVSLLGQSFLSRIENVEITGDQMILGGGY